MFGTVTSSQSHSRNKRYPPFGLTIVPFYSGSHSPTALSCCASILANSTNPSSSSSSLKVNAPHSNIAKSVPCNEVTTSKFRVLPLKFGNFDRVAPNSAPVEVNVPLPPVCVLTWPPFQVRLTSPRPTPPAPACTTNKSLKTVGLSGTMHRANSKLSFTTRAKLPSLTSGR